MVVAGPTHKSIGAVTTANDIVSVTAGKGIVAISAEKPHAVYGARGIEHIVARTAICPLDRRSGKVEGNTVRALNDDPVGAFTALDAYIIGIDIQGIVTCTTIEGIRTAIATQLVVAGPTHKSIGAVAAANNVIAVTAGEGIVAVSAEKPDTVCRARGIEHIVARTAICPFNRRSGEVEGNTLRSLNDDPVGAFTTLNTYIIGVDIQRIVACTTIQNVSAVIASQLVVASPTHKSIGAVAAADDVVSVAAGEGIVAVSAKKPHAVCGPRGIEHIVACTAVSPFNRRSGKVEGNTLRTLNDDPVGAFTTLYADIVRINIQNIVSGTAVKTIRAAIAIQPVIAIATDKRVLFGRAADSIIPRGSYS